MKLIRTLMSFALLGGTAAAVGCEDQRAAIVQAYPQVAPILGGRAKPSPFALNTGSITGFVYGASGKSQPIPLAFVTTGSVSTFAGNPDKSKAVQEENEFDTGD